MTNSTTSTSRPSQDSEIWDHLKQVIANSSGFGRWQQEHPVGDQLQEYSLDHRVSRYLRETLETLAY